MASRLLALLDILSSRGIATVSRNWHVHEFPSRAVSSIDDGELRKELLLVKSGLRLRREVRRGRTPQIQAQMTRAFRSSAQDDRNVFRIARREGKEETRRHTSPFLMFSAVLNFPRFVSPRQTATTPNSWATICLWRRFFEIQEKEEAERMDEVTAALQEAQEHLTPIRNPEVVAARIEFSRRTPMPTGSILDGMTTTSSSSTPSVAANPTVATHGVDRAAPSMDLRVPVNNGEWQYLAQ